MKGDLETIGARIRAARQRAGFTQLELANRLEATHKDAVSKWECDVHYPRRRTIFNLAKVLGVEVEWLERAEAFV